MSEEIKMENISALTDDELEEVTGGSRRPDDPNSEVTCSKCNLSFKRNSAAWLSHKKNCNG